MSVCLFQLRKNFARQANFWARFTFLIIFSVFCTYSFAQSTVTFDAGQVFSTYKYTDSQGEEKSFSRNITGCFSIGYQYVTNSGLFIRVNAGMRKGGASIVYNEVKVSWQVQYADAGLGVGYIYNKWRLKPYLSVSPYYASMLKAEQTIGQDNYDIKKNKSMASSDFGLYISPGFKISLTNSVACFFEYREIIGLQNLETSSNQKSYNRGSSVNIGVSVAIIKYNYVTK